VTASTWSFAMTPRPHHALDTPHFALLDTIARRLAHQAVVDELTRQAVSVLTTDADPDRADRLAIRPGEPAPLVERMAAWALARATYAAVEQARRLLEDGQAEEAVTAGHGREPEFVRCA
jgi:hypothetical protein